MVLASIIFLVAAATYRRYLPLFACLLVLSLGLIVQSKSASSVLIAAGLLGISTVALFIRRLNISRLGSAMMLLAMTATLAAVASIGAEQILGILGKDSSLTGRTVLWATVAAELIDRPLLGFGFQAFWLGNTAEFATVWSVVRWAPPNAHNGYLDVALSLGLTGLLLVLITIVATGSKVVAMAASVARDNSRYLPALIFAYFLLSNAGESALVQQNHILWVLFVWASLASQPEPALQPAVVAAR
jgi:O-antigen ligase